MQPLARFAFLVALLTLALAATGCVWGPGLALPAGENRFCLRRARPHVEPADIRPGAAPAPVFLDFTCDISRPEYADGKRARAWTDNVLANSGLFTAVVDDASKAAARLQLSLRDEDVHRPDSPDRLSMSLAVGRTEWPERFVLEVVWILPDKPPVAKTYRHELVEVNWKSLEDPPDLEPVSCDEGMPTIVRELVLRALQELQDEERISG